MTDSYDVEVAESWLWVKFSPTDTKTNHVYEIVMTGSGLHVLIPYCAAKKLMDEIMLTTGKEIGVAPV